jgi:hypothetical protein
LSIEGSNSLDIERRDHARDVLERASKTASTSAGHFVEGNALPTEQVSALVLQWMYQAAAFYIRMNRENSNSDYPKSIEILKLGIRKLESRWKVAGDLLSYDIHMDHGTDAVTGTYIRMLEAREVMHIG